MRFLVLVVLVHAVVLSPGCKQSADAPSLFGGGRDPKFDQVKKGMSEEDVRALLGPVAWDYTPRMSGIWTSPPMTLQEFHENPERNREIKDVIFVYFRDGKVDNVYRKTGEEFRQPRPR